MVDLPGHKIIVSQEMFARNQFPAIWVSCTKWLNSEHLNKTYFTNTVSSHVTEMGVVTVN